MVRKGNERTWDELPGPPDPGTPGPLPRPIGGPTPYEERIGPAPYTGSLTQMDYQFTRTNLASSSNITGDMVSAEWFGRPVATSTSTTNIVSQMVTSSQTAGIAYEMSSPGDRNPPDTSLLGCCHQSTKSGNCTNCGVETRKSEAQILQEKLLHDTITRLGTMGMAVGATDRSAAPTPEPRPESSKYYTGKRKWQPDPVEHVTSMHQRRHSTGGGTGRSSKKRRKGGSCSDDPFKAKPYRTRTPTPDDDDDDSPGVQRYGLHIRTHPAGAGVACRSRDRTRSYPTSKNSSGDVTQVVKLEGERSESEPPRRKLSYCILQQESSPALCLVGCALRSCPAGVCINSGLSSQLPPASSSRKRKVDWVNARLEKRHYANPDRIENLHDYSLPARDDLVQSIEVDDSAKSVDIGVDEAWSLGKPEELSEVSFEGSNAGSCSSSCGFVSYQGSPNSQKSLQNFESSFMDGNHKQNSIPKYLCAPFPACGGIESSDEMSDHYNSPPLLMLHCEIELDSDGHETAGSSSETSVEDGEIRNDESPRSPVQPADDSEPLLKDILGQAQVRSSEHTSLNTNLETKADLRTRPFTDTNQLFRSDTRGDGEVTRMGGGESYRPTARPRSPPRADTFRSSDRDRRTPPVSDSYHPGERRRSRSPGYRRDRTPPRNSANWRERPRSPPRARSPLRRFSPRRDDDRRERARSPRRDERRRSRSPFDRNRAVLRDRSPIPSRRSRSPPVGPRGAWRARSRSSERRRDDRPATGPSSATWRRRSPSPPARGSERSSGRTSGNTSRRSSPHIHPSRLGLAPALSREIRPRSPPPRSPPTTQLAYRDRDSARSTPKERSPARQAQPRSPPRGPSSFKPPTGPGASRTLIAPTSSTNLSSSNTISSTSAHNRSENISPANPPSGPRGYVPPTRGTYRGRGGVGRGGFESDRSRSDWGAAPPSRPVVDTKREETIPVSRSAPNLSPVISSGASPTTVPTGPSIPTGPRAGPSIVSRTSYGPRTHSISTPNGPRPHPAMAGLPQIIPGGRIDPTASGITSEVAIRLKKREEEELILREELKAKEENLRKSLKTWDKMSRESSGMALRSELSERHVRLLAGEGVGGAAF